MFGNRAMEFGASLFVLFAVVHTTRTQTLVEQDFAPVVTATCKAGYMTIKVATNQSFVGALHARDYRTPSCISYGNGTHMTSLVINMLANQGSPDYCGVFVNNKTEERSLPIAVRIHRTLELADDKFYVITCGKAGFKNARNETSLVSLKLLADGHRVQEVYYGRPYTLRADISRPDGTYGIRVKSCFAFSKRNRSIDDNLIDDRGCANNKNIISEFKYNEKLGYADATIFSMFRFPESSELHLQCDIAVCKGACPEVNCDDELSPLARAQPKDIYSETPDEGTIMASTTVFVLEPGEEPLLSSLCDDGTIRPSWLLYLCIAFGLMFLIMLIINVFLCSAMTCACARTEVIEKEPSIIEDYDPYRSWHGSQYGSRYSLNGKPGYVSGGSTMNSTRSISTNSDHYAIVHSRPGSRYSPGQKNGHRGPSSNLGSHYSGKM
ncbi:uncharacterized protein LOC128994455 [Macrosteles quadrilineatus]|uniref:uncharacterized protein LOC128994455 n=1 Tax=Macrosteles quadrilineatus TaxID=74068 RepID=UPI0023E14D1D|nr:uncharacterized protein LOC128994455 [Macrosteles quadrilineatus]